MATNGGDLRSRVMLLEESMAGLARINREMNARLARALITLNDIAPDSFEAKTLSEALESLDKAHDALVLVERAFLPEGPVEG